MKDPRYSLKPGYEFNIMGRIHCDTSDPVAFWFAVGALKKNGIDVEGKALFYHVGRCMIAHHMNRKEYVSVLRGV